MDPQLDEPDLRSYLGVIARRKWLVAAVTVVFLGAAIAMSVLVDPRYEVKATVQTMGVTDPVTLSLNDGRFGVDPERQAQNQLAFLESTELRFAVIEACTEQMSCDDAWNVEAQAVTQNESNTADTSNVVDLTLTATDPERSASLLDLYAQTYVTELQAIEEENLVTLSAQLSEYIADIDRQIQDLQNQGGDNGPTLTALNNLKADYEGDVFNLTFSTGLANGGGSMVLSRPSVPNTPVSPNIPRNLAIGLIFGLFLGVAVAFLRDYFDDSIKSKEMVERVTALPVLGLIPRFDAGSSELVAARASSAPAAEAFRSLRTSVKFLSVDREVRVVQVTSPSPGEGKTVVAANLATVFAQAGDRVVLVGADLRRPRVEELLGVPLTPGLTGVLIGEVALPQAIRGVEGLPNLSVLPAGYPPPNPSELLSGDRARRLVDVLAQTYDLVVVDSPPVLPVSDAVVLARMADATLLVTAANRTSRRALDRAVEVLQQVGAPLFGSVLSSLAKGATYGGAYSNEAYRYDEPTLSRHKSGKKPSRGAPVAAGSAVGGGFRDGDGNGTRTDSSLWQPADSPASRPEPRGSGSSSSIWPPDTPSRS